MKEKLNANGMSLRIERDTRFEKLREAADLMWPGAGAWACDSWRLLNDYVWDGRLTFNGIVFGLTPWGGSMGYYRPDWNVITLHSSLLPEYRIHGGSAFAKGNAHALDVLLHEMCHQAGHQFGRYVFPKDPKVDYHHHHCWTDTVNEISTRAGLGDYFLPVYKRTKASKKNGEKGRGNIWVASDPDAVSDAQSRGLLIAPFEAIAHWPSRHASHRLLRTETQRLYGSNHSGMAECLIEFSETSNHSIRTVIGRQKGCFQGSNRFYLSMHPATALFCSFVQPRDILTAHTLAGCHQGQMAHELTKREAADLLDVSERAINRYITRGKLTVDHRRNPGGWLEEFFDEKKSKHSRENSKHRSL